MSDRIESWMLIVCFGLLVVFNQTILIDREGVNCLKRSACIGLERGDALTYIAVSFMLKGVQRDAYLSAKLNKRDHNDPRELTRVNVNKDLLV